MAGQRKRGFAAMSPEKQREIASKGGQAAHRKGTAHEFSSEEAREAGRLGGKIISSNRAHMALIGRKGGQHSLFAQRAAKASTGNGQQERQDTAPREQSVPASQGATDLLRADHRRVNGLFHQYEAQDIAQGDSAAVVQQLCDELDIHTQLEEEIFYPALRERLDEHGQQQLDEGLKEHQRIKEFIAQVRNLIAEGNAYGPQVKELYKCVDHHVHEEEHNLLPKAEQQLSDRLEALEAQMRERKQHHAANATRSHSPANMARDHMQE